MSNENVWPETAIEGLQDDVEILMGPDGFEKPSGMIGSMSKSRLGGLIQAAIRMGVIEGKNNPSKNSVELADNVLQKLTPNKKV